MDFSKVLPFDKCLHIIAGFAIFALSLHFIGANSALGAAFVVGVLKEFYDALSKKGTFDPVDALATWAGAALAYSCTLVF